MLSKLIAIVSSCTMFVSCGEGNNLAEVIDSSLHMRPPVPVIVESPSAPKLSPRSCILVVRDQDWLFSKESDTTVCKTLQEFRAFIKANGGSRLNGNIALQADSKMPARIDETIALLKQDSIVRFNLITDLHDSSH